MTDDHVTVGEIRGFLTRQRQALSEAGRPDLAEVAHLVITDDRLQLVCADVPSPDRHDPVLLKAVSIDPIFEHQEDPAHA